MSSVKFQEVIDEYKQQLPDQLYKKLCDLNMMENKREEQDVHFYKIKYVRPDHHYDDDDDNNITVSIKTKIVQLEKKWYNRVSSDINEKGWCLHNIAIENENGELEYKDIVKNKQVQVYNWGGEFHNKTFHYTAFPKIISIECL